MARIESVVPETAGPETRQILELVNRKLGTVPNVIATMANSAAVANAYLGFSQALSDGLLPARLREQIALLAGEHNGCNYCLAAHTALAKGVGLKETETLEARLGQSRDRKEQAALAFAGKILDKRGRVSDSDIRAVREAGFNSGEIVEIIANVVLNILTNYVNLVADTEIDFPFAPALPVHESSTEPN